jgi:CelD/BcsL family acetyltransferase involved in cellulose biosynthesis
LLRGVLQEGLGYVGVITHDGRPIAASVFLCFGGTVIYKYGASATDTLSLRPNEWLMYQAICLASEEGFNRFDFGVSAKEQEGLRRFKKKWGAVESDVYTVSLVGPPEQPRHASPAVKIAAGVIRRSPRFVCRALGEVFYRFAG